MPLFACLAAADDDPNLMNFCVPYIDIDQNE